MTPAEREVVNSARNLILAIDGYLAEHDWLDMPFGVHCSLIVLGEKLQALDAPASVEVVSPPPPSDGCRTCHRAWTECEC